MLRKILGNARKPIERLGLLAGIPKTLAAHIERFDLIRRLGALVQNPAIPGGAVAVMSKLGMTLRDKIKRLTALLALFGSVALKVGQRGADFGNHLVAAVVRKERAPARKAPLKRGRIDALLKRGAQLFADGFEARAGGLGRRIERIFLKDLQI